MYKIASNVYFHNKVAMFYKKRYDVSITVLG